MKKIFFVFAAHACAVIVYAQGTLQIGAGAHVKSTGGVFIVLDNAGINNNGSFQQSAGSGSVKLTGADNISLSGSGTTGINALILSKNSGAIFTLNSNLSIISSINFSGGLLNLNNHVLDLGTTGSLAGESETSRAFTNGSGYLQAEGVLNKPTSISLGNLGAMITSATNLGFTTIKRGHAVQTGVSGSNNSILRYYDIITTESMNLKAELRFHYFDAELNGITESSLYQWKSKNNTDWDFVGADARDIGANYVEKKSINKFDRWTLATATAPVISCPANIIVNANQNGCKALVSFTTTATGVPAATINYAIGNKTITSPYIFPKGETIVTATATNGVAPGAACNFSVTVVCGQGPLITGSSEKLTESITKPSLHLMAYPNPSTNDFSIVLNAPSQDPLTMQVIDIYGRVLDTRKVIANSIIRWGENYKAGVYFVRIIHNKESKEIKLIKL